MLISFSSSYQLCSELGDNYYLGMEFPREFDQWKEQFVKSNIPDAPSVAPKDAKKRRAKLQGTVKHYFDRLWFEACMYVIHTGDVYNPGARKRIPEFWTIDSPFEQSLGEMDQLEAFGLVDRKYHVSKNDGNLITHIQSETETKTIPIPSNTYVIEERTGNKRLIGELGAGDKFECVDRFEVLARHRGYSIVRTSLGICFEDATQRSHPTQEQLVSCSGRLL